MALSKQQRTIHKRAETMISRTLLKRTLIACTVFAGAAIGIWATHERVQRTRSDRARFECELQRRAAIIETQRMRHTQAHLADQVGNMKAQLKQAREVHTEETLAHRTQVDELLSEIAALSGQVDQLETWIIDHTSEGQKNERVIARHKEEEERLRKLLKSERNQAKEQTDVLRRSAALIARDARNKASALDRAKGDLETLTEALDENSKALKELGSENKRLARELRQAVTDREAAFSASQQAQYAASDYLRRLRSQDAGIYALTRTVQKLRSCHNTSHAELHKLRSANRQLSERVRVLNTEVSRLRGLVGRGNTPSPPVGRPIVRKEREIAKR